MLFVSFIPSCKKTDPLNPPVPPVTDSTTGNAVVNSDTISNHLLFLNAIKKQGSMPTAPAGSSLKISYKDTLYIANDVKGPIKFLHEDTTQNVAGVYVQVKSKGGGASYYFDVPEVEEMKVDDTVSVILIGFDPKDLFFGNIPAPPGGSTSFVFDVVMTPYDDNKQPIATATRPVKISKQKINEDGTSGLCGLELPPGDFWQWDLSLIEDPSGNGKLFFYNDPKKVWGGGQLITGCCINGISSYNTVLGCDKDPTKARRKLFPTWFQHLESDIKFFDDGTYSHFSRQINVNPDPTKTNFCGSGQGVVEGFAKSNTETGTWKIVKVPPYKGDSLQLQPFKTAGGFGLTTPRGYIHQLACNTLVLVRPDNEGGNADFVSFYKRINTSINEWYLFL